MARFDLTDFEWSVIAPLLPNKVRGVARVDDRRVLNGIFWRLRTGAPWADIPDRYGPHTTCVNRFNRWRKAGVWDRLLTASATWSNGSSTNSSISGPSQPDTTSATTTTWHPSNSPQYEFGCDLMSRWPSANLSIIGSGGFITTYVVCW